VAVLQRLARSHDEPIIVGTHGNLLALVLAAVNSAIGFDFWRTLSFPDIFRLDLTEPFEKSSFERVWTE
jgi:2,3-bisphosphoglycerate-dependent phosphoglycerate mutase